MTNKARLSPEFTLVLVMLIILTILVIVVLNSSMPEAMFNKSSPNYLEEARIFYEITLDHKRNILAIILTAFGAWVGAGAAYFFGRENLRESAQSLLTLHRQSTGQERLKVISVRDIPPKPLDTILDESITLNDVLEKFTNEPRKWFFPIQMPDKWGVISDEILYMYLYEKLESMSTDQSYGELKNSIVSKSMKEVIDDIRKNMKLTKMMDQFIPVTMDANVAEVNNKMEESKVFLALVMNEAGKFTQFFTTNDIRKALLRI